MGAGGNGGAVSSTASAVTVGAGGNGGHGGNGDATATTGSSMPPGPDAGPVTPLGVKITPGEVQVPVEQYDKGPLIVTSALFGGHGKTAADPIVIKNCKIKSDVEGEPAILLMESDLTVVIDGCTLVGVSPVLISASGLMYKGKYVDGGQARLTVTNTRGYGLAPLTAGHGRPRFLTAGSPIALTIEHNYLEHVSGVYVPNPQPGQPFVFRYNKVKDLDARMTNMVPITTGNGGEPGEGHFVHLSGKAGAPASVPGIEIGWNELVNFPDESASGDHVNIYSLAGTQASPMQVHHNYIQGGYPYPSSYLGQGCRGMKAGGGSTAYTGSGVTTDGHGLPISAPNDVTSWVEFHDNRVVNACNGAINISIGHDVRAHDNRLIHSGILPDAAQTPTSSFSPGGVYDWANIGPVYFHDNSFDHNAIWWPKAGVKPYDDGGQFASSIHDNVDLAAQLGVGATPADEIAEYDAFLSAAQAAGIVIGPL